MIKGKSYWFSYSLLSPTQNNLQSNISILRLAIIHVDQWTRSCFLLLKLNSKPTPTPTPPPHTHPHTHHHHHHYFHHQKKVFVMLLENYNWDNMLNWTTMNPALVWVASYSMIASSNLPSLIRSIDHCCLSLKNWHSQANYSWQHSFIIYVKLDRYQSLGSGYCIRVLLLRWKSLNPLYGGLFIS